MLLCYLTCTIIPIIVSLHVASYLSYFKCPYTVNPWLLALTVVGTLLKKKTFTWDKDIYSRLIVFLRFNLQVTLRAFIGTHVIAGVFYSCVVNEKRRRVVSWVHEGVFRQGFSPNDVSFTGTANVEHGIGLQGELFFIGHNGRRQQSKGNWKIVLKPLEELSKKEGKKNINIMYIFRPYLKPAPPGYPQRQHTSLPHPWLWMF